MNILDKIVEQKKIEVAKLPARIIAAGDLRDAMLERGESRPENQKSQRCFAENFLINTRLQPGGNAEREKNRLDGFSAGASAYHRVKTRC